jgi:hypothetical protein
MKRILSIVVLVATIPIANAAPVDLTSWSPLTLNFPGAQPAGNWVLGGGNTEVTQTVNADPSFFLNNLNQTSYSIDGSWQVLTSSDDDFMGFVFGYQDSSNFYLFDWKQSEQNDVYDGSDANEGMTIKRYSGATGDGLTDLSLGAFWENVNAASFTGLDEILASNHGGDKGWIDKRLYEFHLDFNLSPGEIHIEVVDTVTTGVLWDVTVNDSTYTAGEFGFYNFSQEDVRYAGFEQEGGIIVPEPTTILLLGLGLAGLGFARKRLH